MAGGLLRFLQTAFGTIAPLENDLMTHRITETPDVKKLRAYATRLMAFALKAVSEEDMDFAERLTDRASECLDRAQATDGLATHRRPSSPTK